jgi:coniferyl-aldehyde dehydrogenase
MKRVKKWMKPQRRHVNTMFLPARAKVIYQPLGVVGIIVPWNYPIFLALGPLITALASGNRAMIKVSEFTPNTNKVFHQLITSCFAESEVAVIEGEADVAAKFSEIPFDHMLFTGSTQVGRHVMRAASENLTPVTLELGGKSPALIAPDMPPKTAIQRLLWGKTLNSGQTCVSPDYILCPEGKLEEVIKEARIQFQAMYPSPSTNPDYTSVINDRQYARLNGLLQEVETQGTRVENLTNDDSKALKDKRKIPLTLIINPSNDSLIMKDEIFGPLFPIITYKTVEDALTYIHQRPRPLALYLFSFDKELQNKCAYSTHSGALTVNDAVMHVAQDDIPFGGIGPSGMGHYHGKEGFLTLSKAKPVFSQGRLFLGGLVHPPYGTFIHKLIYKLFIR